MTPNDDVDAEVGELRVRLSSYRFKFDECVLKGNAKGALLYARRILIVEDEINELLSLKEFA